MKSVFARHGIPSKVRSYSGSQYGSAEFRQFAESWGFTHTVSSPHYQQSNRLAERFVQSVKKMLSKSKQDGKDPYIAMLKYRNTPSENLDSPAQLLMNRRLRTTIPTIKNRLKPKCAEERRGIKKVIRELYDKNGKLCENKEDIINIVRYFYKDLYSSQKIENNRILDYLENIKLNKLEEADWVHLNPIMTTEECYKNTMDFQNNKTPGIDGLGKAFYVKFWDIIGEDLTEVINNIYLMRELR
ncbi:unnamed protein product [Mytilus coruscus]|uniref:Integrase catalytic domain-containing protein n=1 Tax=Mytilus coruscus TaxID=42192 RepID=A0A6J8EYJ8_MYTCO|nr:unnamed protein product [Mytilus coruscus]